MSSIAVRLEYITKNGIEETFALSIYFESDTVIWIDLISLQRKREGGEGGKEGKRERERERESLNTRADHLRKDFDLLLWFELINRICQDPINRRPHTYSPESFYRLYERHRPVGSRFGASSFNLRMFSKCSSVRSGRSNEMTSSKKGNGQGSLYFHFCILLNH